MLASRCLLLVGLLGCNAESECRRPHAERAELPADVARLDPEVRVTKVHLHTSNALFELLKARHFYVASEKHVRGPVTALDPAIRATLRQLCLEGSYEQRLDRLERISLDEVFPPEQLKQATGAGCGVLFGGIGHVLFDVLPADG